ENVKEFRSWGPLDEKGKPISRTAGSDYIFWMDQIRNFGYKSDEKLLNAADFGSCQSRKRLFIQFHKSSFPYSWPEQTHSKD
ncbi:DNA cytosine methyltransferase, partial [Lacticaseibacillus paracasei]